MNMKIDIRTNKKEGETTLFTRLRIGGKSEHISLQLKVDIKQWIDVRESDRKRENYLDRMGYTKFIMDIEFGIKQLKRDGNDTMEHVDTLIRDIVLKEQREKLLKSEELRKKVKERETKSVKTYMTNFIRQIESGEVRTKKGELYSRQSIKMWKQLSRILLDFYTHNPFTWEEIDKNLVNKFLTHLEKNGYMKKTRDKYMRLFKQVISDAEILGYHTNHTAKFLITRLTIKESDKSKEIYLTKEELEGMYNMKLEGYQEIVRDLFLIGCYTGQRFSDFSTINEGCVVTTFYGRSIKIEQVKTGNLVVVPIIEERLETLLKKYNYTVPTVSDQFFNREIKEIGRMLAETVPSLARKERTVLRKQERLAEEKGVVTFERDSQGYVVKPRYQLISSHTCRRSCITNMYKSGKYTIPVMMSVSGHKDERTFREYVKLDKDELAEMVVKSSEGGMF